MNLRRQLLLVSVLTLILPWSGCQFVRETESALREGQQAMLGGAAKAIADSLSQFPSEFLSSGTDGTVRDKQLYAHPLEIEPLIDGYREDWTLDDSATRRLRGADGEIRYVLGSYRRNLYVFVDVRDASPNYAEPNSLDVADRIELVSVDAEGRRETLVFAAEAPGQLIGRRYSSDNGLQTESRVAAFWLSTPEGYRLEARVPWQLVGDYFGLVTWNARGGAAVAIRSATFDDATPGRVITPSPVLTSAVAGYAQEDLRLIVTDRAGWRLAQAGSVGRAQPAIDSPMQRWLRSMYGAVLEPGQDSVFAEPNPLGRERQPYILSALGGDTDGGWFRSSTNGRAIVAVAEPVWSGSVQTGAVVLQQGTESILTLTNSALGRLMMFTLLSTLGVAAVLLAYASWLSLRIRRLSAAARLAIDPQGRRSLPSALASDEIGDLSRQFSSVLGQLGDYNEYLRSLASKLSHELRTPLTIVSSSLDNLEHERLSPDAAQYTDRARDGVIRLRKILDAMSEANRVEELMEQAEPENVDIKAIVEAAVGAYASTWPQRKFHFSGDTQDTDMTASPELIVQMLDKLIDNAISFSADGDEIEVTIARDERSLLLTVYNPGPRLPDKMRRQMFDSMVSMRNADDGKHLGLGLYVARLIAEGHNGGITAENVRNGVRFVVRLVGVPR